MIIKVREMENSVRVRKLFHVIVFDANILVSDFYLGQGELEQTHLSKATEHTYK